MNLVFSQASEISPPVRCRGYVLKTIRCPAQIACPKANRAIRTTCKGTTLKLLPLFLLLPCLPIALDGLHATLHCFNLFGRFLKEYRTLEQIFIELLHITVGIDRSGE